MKNIIELDSLQFQDIIRYPDLSFSEGSCSLIFGESGSGKSTLLKLLNRTETPASGKIYFRGSDLAELDPLIIRRKILLIPQEVFLLDKTVQDNFTFYFSALGEEIPSPDKMTEYLRLACADFDLHADCSVLSGGERQRVFLAIYLALKPEVLLLDEPTAALDDETAEKLLRRLKEHSRENGQTLIIVSHQKDLAAPLADQVIELTR